MNEERPSITAEGAAVMRALHQSSEHEPRILDDPISPRLVDMRSDFYKARIELLQRLPPLTRSRFETTFVMRNRFAEDCLAAAADRGVRQYVVLGAGLDTFAYRQPPWARSLHIFEVDQFATQQWKRRLLSEANISAPGNLSFVPVDFERTSLATALRQARLDLNVATFFSLLGVTQYLTEEALDQTLQFILSGCGGSEIVFSFVVSDELLPADNIGLVKAIAAQSAAAGEPWISRFHPDQLVARLRSMRFSGVFHLSPEEANQRYFQNRRDGLTASILEQMIRAIV